MTTKRTFIATAAALIAGLAVSGASAQTWPGKPIRILVPSTPGSAPDLIARIMGDKLSRSLSQPVIVENRTGAGGLISMNQLKQAPADGYTLTLMHGAVAAVTPFTYKEATYDVVRDFEIIGTVGMTPMLFVSNPAFPAKNLAEAIAVARANPEKIALGSSVRGSIPNLTNELLATRTGAKFQVVPFASSGQGIQATVGGDVPMFSDGVAPLIQLIKSGRLRALAVASETVLPGLEGIPLANDTVPGFNVYGWFLMVAPKGTPKDIVTRLNKEVNDAIHLPDVVERFRHLGTYPRPGTVESAQQFVRSEITLFGGIIKAAGIKPE